MKRGGAPTQDALPRRLILGWAFGAFPQGLANYAFSVLFFRYLVDTVALSAALVGGLIAANKVYDGIIDAGIGHVSDRLNTPLGGRLPLMLLGGVLLGLAMILMFSVPMGGALFTKLIWIVAGLTLFSTGFSLFAIPWMAMPAEMTDAFDDRTGMMAWRTFFAASGHGAGSLLGPGVLAALGMGVVAYDAMGAAVGALCFTGMLLVCVLILPARRQPPETEARPPLLAQAQLVLTNRPLVILVLMKAALYFGSAMHAAALAIFTSRVMRLPDAWLAASSVALGFTAIASQPLWLHMTRRVGKRRALGVGLIIYSLAMASFSLLQAAWPAASLVAASAVIGIGSGGAFVLAQSLLPDVIEYDALQTGMRRGGAIAGIVSFLETSSAALGVLVLGLILSGAGYVSGVADPGGQPPMAILAIRACCGLVAAAAAALGLIALVRYPLTEAHLSSLRPGRSAAWP